MSVPPPSVPPPVQDEPRPPVQDPVGRYRDAKADAAAANAYAKSQRPWYQKKRFFIPLGLIVLSMFAAATSGGGDSAGTSTEKASSSDDGTAGTVGQPLTNAGTTYTVTNVETASTIGDPMFGATADGTFVIVSLELTNTKDETKTFMDSSSKIVTADGKAYQASDKAVMAFDENESLMLKDIQPDLTTTGKIAFELPPSNVAGSTLVIEDLWGSGEIKVDLGQ